MPAADDELLVRAISLFLDSHWDPIGLFADDGSPRPPAGTEYRGYATHALGMLRQGESAASISHYLTHQAMRTIEVGPSGKEHDAATRLTAWFTQDAEPGQLSP